MQPTQVKQHFHRPGWVYEEKIDGWRMLAYKDGRTVRLESRSGVTIRGAFLISLPPWPRCQAERSYSMARWRSSTASSGPDSTGGCEIPTPRRWRRRPC
jgi:hypothetical protein